MPSVPAGEADDNSSSATRRRSEWDACDMRCLVTSNLEVIKVGNDAHQGRRYPIQSALVQG